MNLPYFHCASCDKRLSDEEVDAKFAGSGNSVGLCRSCIRWLPPAVGVVGLDVDSLIPEEDEEMDSYDEDGYDDDDALQ